MTENEKELLAKVSEEATKAISEKLEGFASQEEISNLKSLVEKSDSTEEITAIKEVVSSLETQLKGLTEAQVEAKKEDAVKFMLDTNKDAIQNIKKDGGKFHQMTLKSFSTDANFNPDWDTFLEPQYVDGIARTPQPKRIFNILNYVTVGTAFSEIIKWIEEDGETGTALFIDECVAKPDVSKDWKRNEAKVKKVAAYTRVCDEVLAYLSWAEQEIRTFLRDVVYEALQEAIINGDGTGENLLGITPQASAFVAGGLATSVPAANRADAIRAAVSQINCLGFNATHVFVGCDDMYLLESEKDLNGQYLRGSLGGVELVESQYIAAGSFLVGDMSKSNVRFFRDITVEMGMNGEDFRENAVSLRSEAWLTHYIASNHVNAFVFDTFANVIALIDKP